MHGAPACVTVKVWPPIVSVPVREVVPALAATLKLTVPLPVPVPRRDREPGVVARGGPAATGARGDGRPCRLPLRRTVRFDDAGEIVNVQGAAGWVTVKVSTGDCHRAGARCRCGICCDAIVD